jgi:benzodiazapine receptor
LPSQQYVDRAPTFTALNDNANLALKLYWLSFGLNMAWTPLFFGAKKVGAALIDILLLTPTVYALTYWAYQVDPRTAIAFVPYSLWTSYASYLNLGVWWLNFGGGSAGIGRSRKLN